MLLFLIFDRVIFQAKTEMEKNSLDNDPCFWYTGPPHGDRNDEKCADP